MGPADIHKMAYNIVYREKFIRNPKNHGSFNNYSTHMEIYYLSFTYIALN